MTSPERLRVEESILLVVDIQARLVPAMFEAERVVRHSAVLARTARLLGVPILVTEQNPPKLGSTVPAVAEAIGQFTPFGKMLFSAGTPEVLEALDALREGGRASVLLCGVETHVCILQTALDLLEAGYNVFVPGNAVTSRYESDKSAALARLGASGCVPVSTEMAVLEWVKDASAPAFKTILPWIK